MKPINLLLILLTFGTFASCKNINSERNNNQKEAKMNYKDILQIVNISERLR